MRTEDSLNLTRMRTESSLDLKRMLKTDRGRETKNESLNELVRPAHKFAKSWTETSSKVREPLTYNKVINNSVYGNRWREIINEEL